MRAHLSLAVPCVALVGALSLFATPAAAQSRFFPDVPRFELPWASPRTWGFVGRYLHVSTPDDAFGRGTEAEVQEGENFPLFAFRQGPLPITLGFGASVVAHYRLDDPRTSQISDDWLVGMNGQFTLSPKWTVVAEVEHESSHLGDKYAERFSLTRIDWTRMQLNGWGFYTTGRWRLAGGLHYVYADQLHLPRTGVSAGADYKGPAIRFLGQPAQLVGGVFAEAWGQTDWRLSKSASFGLSFPAGEHGWRRLSFSAVVYDGPTYQRQFYQMQTAYEGLEVRFDL
ncbi:MAG: DUF1207 domain-containing protein [Gemmatimonadales bacterium]